MPGVVLRVSRIRADVPATASTQACVSVAIPLRWQSRLSAGRSALSTSCVRARTERITSPLATVAPSGTSSAMSASSPQTYENTAAATGTPATTPAARATRSSVAR